MEFKDKVAIVTGASSGIGFGISRKLALKGAIVYLVARNLEKLESAQEKIAFEGGKVEIRSADITDIDSVRNVINEVYSVEKRLDIFVNNAGGYAPIMIDSSFDEIQHMINLDAIAPFMITHYLIQRFSKERENKLKILNVLSQAGIRILDGGIGYGTAKKALTAALFEVENQLKVEGVDNITLYRLYPGTVGTEGVIELVKQGKLQNPTSLESVVDTAIDLLMEKTPTRDAYIGFIPGEGIKRVYFDSDPKKFKLLNEVNEEVVDREFDPDEYIKGK